MMTHALDSSRRALASWIWEELAGIEFSSFYDVFGGNGRVAQLFKRKGYQTFVSDILQCHYWRGVALVQNNQAILTPDHYNLISDDSRLSQYQDFAAWQDHYFTKEEAQYLAAWWNNIENASDFQNNVELKAMAYTAVYNTMSYWLQFNQMYLQSKPLGANEVLRHYTQLLNQSVTDNQMPNVSYYTEASLLLDQLQGVDVFYINPPSMQGFRDTNRKTELAECWTRRITQINLSGLMPTDSGALLGQSFEDEITYLNALSGFLDKSANARIWVLSHSERLGVSLKQFEDLVSQKRSIWKKTQFDLPYPMAGETLNEQETLLIAVAE